MDKIVSVADYLVKRYEDITEEILEERKLHQLLYFVQRESYAIFNERAFDGDFWAWKCGPVSRDVCDVFADGNIIAPTETISRQTKYIVDNCIQEYGAWEAWKLNDITHREISWLNARQGLAPDEDGERVIALEDIREDSKHVRPFDHAWGMYYDEFEDTDAASREVC